MTDNERLIIELLKKNREAAQRLVDRGKIEPETFLRLAERHMIGPMVFSGLSRVRLDGALKQELSGLGQRWIMVAAALNMRLRHELRLASEVLANAEIDFLLIKGFAIDTDPLRTMGDIDILIEERELGSAFSALQTAGYRYTGSGVMSEREIGAPFSTLSWNNQFQFQSPTSPVNIEVHTNLFERDRIRLERLGSLLDRLDLFRGRSRWDEELGCFVPSVEASLALLCVHATTKRSPAHNTFVLRHAYDIDRICKRGVDDERFLYLCRAWGIEYYAYTALRLTALSLGGRPLPETVVSLESALTRRERGLAEVHLKCFRGLGDASVLYRMAYVLRMPAAIGGGIGKALRWYREAVFPPLWAQEARFGVSRTSAAILLTYLYGPFVRAQRAIARSVRAARYRPEGGSGSRDAS